MGRNVTLSIQIRKAIDAAGVSRYRLCKDCEIHEATMSRFMQGLGGLSLDALDRLSQRLGWKLVYEPAADTNVKQKRSTEGK